jgi:hypothetical protein
LALPLLLTLLRPGWFESHEGLSYPIRLVEVAQCWQDGLWSARWFPDLNSGQGYPFLSFYAPLLFWIAGAFHVAGADVALALRLAAIVGVLLAAFGIDRLVREGTTTNGAGIVAAGLYIYAPYFVRDMFIRGDLAESLALGLLPWSLYGMLRLRRCSGAGDVAFAAFAGALPILAHNILGLFNGLLLALTGIIAFATSSLRPRWRTARAVVAAGIGALALSAFFWAPALLEKKFVQIDKMTSGYYEVSKHFVRVEQFLGRGEFPSGQDQGLPMSFELGWVGIACVLVAAAFARSLWRFHRPLFIMGVLFCMVGTARAMKVSAPVYETFELLRYVQFPWRFLSVTALGIAILGGLAYERTFVREGNLLSRISAAVICIAAIVFVFPLLGPRPSFSLPSWALDPEAYRTKRETTTIGEYLPIWAQETEAPRGFENGVKIEGEGRVESARRQAGKIKATLELPAPSKVVFQDLYFPGWKVLANGDEVDLAPEERTGRMSVQLPSGRHELEARLELTGVRMVSGILSASAGALLLAWAAASSIRMVRRAQ